MRSRESLIVKPLAISFEVRPMAWDSVLLQRNLIMGRVSGQAAGCLSVAIQNLKAISTV